jgi:hypothetical protein
MNPEYIVPNKKYNLSHVLFMLTIETSLNFLTFITLLLLLIRLVSLVFVFVLCSA